MTDSEDTYEVTVRVSEKRLPQLLARIIYGRGDERSLGSLRVEKASEEESHADR